MKVSVYIATSLDGFIARKNGDIDWLSSVDDGEDDDDYGFAEFFSTVDCLIMGRNTFDMVAGFDGWAYGDTPIIVLSRHLTAPPEQFKEKVNFYQGDLKALIQRLEKEGDKHLYIDGGETIQAFINEGLVTDITITKIPVETIQAGLGYNHY